MEFFTKFKKYRKAAVVAGSVLSVLVLVGLIGGRKNLFDQVQLKINAPMMAVRGEHFSIEVLAKNSDKRRHNLYEVVLSPWYLEGVAVARTDPAFDNLYIENGAHIYRFDTPIEPGAELMLQFDALAAKIGDYPAKVKVCFDNRRRCVQYPLRTIIEEQ